MPDTLSQTQQTTIQDLKAAVREAQAAERALAVEQDGLPEKIRQAAREDARRAATAAREGGAGAEVVQAAQESEVPALRERLASMPYLRWSAGITTASLELSLAEAQIAASEEEAEELKVGLEGLKLDADEANRLYQDRLAAIRRAESGASMTSYARHAAKQRLRELEQEHPDA